jgi:hypothetical protein
MTTDGAEATDARRGDEQNTPSGGDPEPLLERVRCAVLGPQVAAAVVVLLMIALAALYLPGRDDGGAWQRQASPSPPPAPGAAAAPPADHTLAARTDATPRAFAAPPAAGSASGEPAGASGGEATGAGDEDVPSHADALLVQARKQRKARDCRAAVHTYEAFLLGHRQHPDAPQAMLEVAECHQRLTQRVRALHWLTQATRHPQASDEAGKRLQALRRLMDEGP